MTRIGFHASHEQISPRQLLRDVQHAERAGFQMAICSDHFSPWSRRQGHSGFAWSWLGAALATTELSFGCVTAPGQRTHPAVLAQKIATLGQMFPGRFWAALGSGQNLNEHITGDKWPLKTDRIARLEECVTVIRRLLDGEEVTQDGYVTVDRARVWESADPIPQLIGPAVSVESAERVAAWADGFVTLNQPIPKLREMLDAYRGAGGTGRTSLQIHLSWADTDEEAEGIAHEQWRSNVFDEPVNWDTATPEAFDLMAEHVQPGAMHEDVRISSDPSRHAEWIAEYAELGFDDIYLHHVGQDQGPFINRFADEVLPRVAG